MLWNLEHNTVDQVIMPFFAFVLAKQETCPLITGDAQLRRVVVAEGVELRGTIWIVEQMIIEGFLTCDEAQEVFDTMKSKERRFSWDKADEMITLQSRFMSDKEVTVRTTKEKSVAIISQDEYSKIYTHLKQDIKTIARVEKGATMGIDKAFEQAKKAYRA